MKILNLNYSFEGDCVEHNEIHVAEDEKILLAIVDKYGDVYDHVWHKITEANGTLIHSDFREIY